MARRAREAGRTLAFGPALHELRVRAAFVELQRCVARNMTILAARMLKYFLDHGEIRIGVGASSRARCGDAGECKCGQKYMRRAHGVLLIQARRSGNRRKRLPVSANTALATAGAIGGVPGSPQPPI